MKIFPSIAVKADEPFQGVMLMGFYHQKCVRFKLCVRTGEVMIFPTIILVSKLFGIACLVEELFLRAKTAIYELFIFHEPNLCYTIVVITLLPLRIPYLHFRGKRPRHWRVDKSRQR